MVEFRDVFQRGERGARNIMVADPIARRLSRWNVLTLDAIVGFLAVAGLFMLRLAMPASPVAAWALVIGCLGLAASFRLPMDHGPVWLAIGPILFGVLLAITPLFVAVVFAWRVGAYAFAFGISILVFAFTLRPSRGHGAHFAFAAQV